MTKFSSIYKKGTLSKALVLPLCFSAMLSLTGCGDFLEIEPRNEITLEKFWNEKSDVTGTIASCYTTIAQEPILARMLVWGEFRSENVVINDEEADINLERVLKENITANNAYTYWGDFYSVINRCNIVMKYAPQVAEIDPSYSDSELRAHIAEVTALRSLMYFYLIRTFRDVPYTDEVYLDDNQVMVLPTTSFDDVLSKIIASLEAVKDDAISKYPEVKTGSAQYFDTGRITKWAIYAMLADMYLWQKNYDKCIEYTQAIIDQKKKSIEENKNYSAADFVDFDGYPIIGTRYRSMNNTYGQAFNNIFFGGNSIESIFEINFVKNSGSSQPSNIPVSKFYGNASRSPFVTYSTFVGLDETDEIYKVFSKSNAGLDARGYENFFRGDHNNIYKYTPAGELQITFTKGSSVSDISKRILRSSLYTTEGTNYDSRNKSNFIIYRLTDIMLMQAEAYTQKIAAESGVLTDETDKKYCEMAFKLVNAVNKRSVMQYPLADTLKHTAYNSKELITNLVYDERNRELMFEGKHYYDLVRRAQREGNTEYIRSRCKLRSSDLETVIESKLQKMDAIYWPYNLNEMKVNKLLVQNPAFGSGENSYSNSATK